MKLNRISLLLILLAALALMAFTSLPEATPPSLPDWAIGLINIGLTWLITNGLKSLSRSLPWIPSIEGQASTLVAALVGFLVVFGNGLLGMIPASYHPAVSAMLVFAGTILSAYGLHFTVAKFTQAR